MRGDWLCSKGLRLEGKCLLTHTGALETRCLISPQQPLESEWWWCSVAVTSNSATHGLIAYLAPLSMEFSRQECWSRLPFLLQEIFPDQGSKLHLLHWQVDSLPLSQPGKPHLRATHARYPHFYRCRETEWLDQGPVISQGWGQDSDPHLSTSLNH